MTADIVDAVLWRVRAALRLDGAPLFAGHGLADPMYRPPRLPYASVLGPLSYTIEPERALPQDVALTVRLPGYLAGTALAPDVTVPGPGELELLVDGEVRLTVAVDHGADTGAALSEVRAAALAARIETAVLDAVGAATVDGTPLSAERAAEVSRTTARWDTANRRLVIASGRRGPAQPSTGEQSSVSLAAPTPQAAALGLVDAAVTSTGRLVRHQLPAPTAMAFDVRVDLWAGSQRHLAALVEAWARVTPTRCQLMLRPALLAADVPDGADELHLQAGGEPATRWTQVQLEPEGGFADRRTARIPTLAGGAAPAATALALPSGATARLRFGELPAVPDPTRPAHPAPTGWAVSTGVRVPSAGDGDELAVVRLLHGSTVALAVDLTWVDVPAGNGQPAGLHADVAARAQAADGTDLPPATLRLPASMVDEVTLHALVDATAGQVSVFAGDAGAQGAALGPVAPAGGDDMDVVLGGPAGPDSEVTHLHVLSRPVGPLDHRQRDATATASRWRPGDPVTLVRSHDGVTPQGAPFTAVVTAVEDGVLHLDRPVSGTWPRHDSVVATRVVFSRQTAVRRRDDLATNLTRVSLEHTVSGFVEPDSSSLGVQLVESLDLQVADRARLLVGHAASASARTPPSTPGVTADLVPARSLRSTVVTADDAAPAPQPAPPEEPA